MFQVMTPQHIHMFCLNLYLQMENIISFALFGMYCSQVGNEANGGESMYIRLSFVFYSISVRSWIRIQVRGCLPKWLMELLLYRRAGKGLGVRELPKDSRLRILKVPAECT